MLVWRDGRALAVALVAAVLAVGSVGCGGSDDEEASSVAERTTTAVDGAPSESGGAASGDGAESGGGEQGSPAGEQPSVTGTSPGSALLRLHRAYLRADKAGVCAEQEGNIAECSRRKTSFTEIARRAGAFEVLRRVKVLDETRVGARRATVTVRVAGRTSKVRMIRTASGDWRVASAQTDGEVASGFLGAPR